VDDHTGRRVSGAGIGVDENTPLQIGDTLYSCTPLNVVTALDADTGKRAGALTRTRRPPNTSPAAASAITMYKTMIR
jgi:glucose dehydrogenase